MIFEQTPINGVWLIKPEFRSDERGHFFRAWCSEEFAQHGIEFVPVQANLGFSKRAGTVRGMHFQTAPALESKLVRCTKGSMFDVAVDLRAGSVTYGRWAGYELSQENGHMLFVPEQCAHGYQTLVDDTEMYYMTSQFYNAEAAHGLRFDDPSLSIHWPMPPTVVSAQDRNWPLAADIK